MRVLSLFLAFLALSACGSGGSDVPVKSVDDVMAIFNDTITGCTAGLTEQGAIDQAAMAATGWKVTERKSRFEIEDREHALGVYPELQAGEYEATTWSHADHGETIELIRWDLISESRLADSCTINTRVDDDDDVKSVIAALAKKFDRKADRRGILPRGGDFLTPRSDKPLTGYYWAMPKNDIYLAVGEEEHLRLEVVAMPDRSKLDQYSSDNPEIRIPT